MKNFFSAFKMEIKPAANQLFDLILSLIERQDLSTMSRVTADSYVVGDATVTVKYFDKDAFEEIQLSFGYTMGEGVTVVLRNYAEHLIVLNHEILGTYHTLEFSIPTESFALKEYRKKFDEAALATLKALEGLGDA